MQERGGRRLERHRSHPRRPSPHRRPRHKGGHRRGGASQASRHPRRETLRNESPPAAAAGAHTQKRPSPTRGKHAVGAGALPGRQRSQQKVDMTKPQNKTTKTDLRKCGKRITSTNGNLKKQTSSASVATLHKQSPEDYQGGLRRLGGKIKQEKRF